MPAEDKMRNMALCSCISSWFIRDHVLNKSSLLNCPTSSRFENITHSDKSGVDEKSDSENGENIIVQLNAIKGKLQQKKICNYKLRYVSSKQALEEENSGTDGMQEKFYE
nr:hypothetical protein Iba_chr02aCG14170 [Ipomoea batatas]